jgi:hypothetical protein
VRSLLDLVRPVRVTGTVLDIGVAGQQPSADAAEAGLEIPDLVTHYLVVVDDGSSDVLRPWIVNRDIARDGAARRPRRPDSDRPDLTDPAALAAWHERLVRPGFQPGDRVRLVGQRWSRFVTSLERVPDSAQPAARLFTERGA